MRSSTRPRRCWVRRCTVAWRKSIHSASIWRRLFCVGRPSRPTIVRLIGTLPSRLVCASSAVISSPCSTVRLRGSNTRRTGASLLDSSRTASSTASTAAFSCTCSCDSAFLPALTFGLVSSSISSSTFCALVPGGSSVTTSCHWPRARSSIFQRARSFSEPRPAAVGLADVGGAGDDLRAAGEVRRRQQLEQLLVRQPLVADQRHRRGRHLAQVVARDLGGQADGNAAGAVEQHEGQPRRQQRRLLRRAVVVGHEVDRAFVDLVQQQPGDRRQARLGVAHRRGAVAVAAAEVALAVDQRVALAKSPAPCAPARRRPPGRCAGGSGRARRRRRARSSPAWALRRRRRPGPCAASNRGCGAAPASARRTRRAARGP